MLSHFPLGNRDLGHPDSEAPPPCAAQPMQGLTSDFRGMASSDEPGASPWPREARLPIDLLLEVLEQLGHAHSAG